MRLHATYRASHLTFIGAAAVGLGIATSLPEMVVYGSALVSGIALSRALTLVSVARARSAGFEMLWLTGVRALRATRLQEISLTVELRNRDGLPTRFRGLTVTHAPGLEVRTKSQNGEIPPHGCLRIPLSVTPLQAGFHGIHSITLNTVRAPGLYTVPLSFTSPFVLEVLPHPVQLGLSGARGGRSRQSSPDGRRGTLPGDGPELRELRELQPGDPFRSIAWKASARRGRLLVVEKELEERDAVWILIDASVDSMSGGPQNAPIHRATDDATRIFETHLARGDLVGMILFGSRELCRVPLGRGPKHAAKLLSALAFECHTADADRSDWDERDVLTRVLEHTQGLDASAAGLSREDRDGLTIVARRLLDKAPIVASAPFAPSSSERLFRQYLLSFGIQPPPRLTSDRHLTESLLARTLLELPRQKPRPSIFYVLGKSPSFETSKSLLDTLGGLRKKRVEVRFLQHETHLGAYDVESPQQQLAHVALASRLALAEERGTDELRRRGVKVIKRKAHRYRAIGRPI